MQNLIVQPPFLPRLLCLLKLMLSNLLSIKKEKCEGKEYMQYTNFIPEYSSHYFPGQVYCKFYSCVSICHRMKLVCFRWNLNYTQTLDAFISFSNQIKKHTHWNKSFAAHCATAQSKRNMKCITVQMPNTFGPCVYYIQYLYRPLARLCSRGQCQTRQS